LIRIEGVWIILLIFFTFEVMVVTLLDHLNRFLDHGHLPKLCDNEVG